ncbi:hypothetical protein [Xylocopilactobacillus apicola]|uniref:Uncharacterized protein n=1 Tax=Xylocopilactobacillus apicola TaxID=2932184 RepID=A0AAU9D3G2_9LACO|nr:hypothetical protein [Xylocopilactobacillus apicola]BDR59376.1 hypothetical protein XA3_18170 [Xylocopilactobacillus apicola]
MEQDNIKLRYKENKLNISDKTIRLSSCILEAMSNLNHVFVLLKVQPGEELTRDVICNFYSFNRCGDLEWQVQNFSLQNSNGFIYSPIVGVDLDEEDYTSMILWAEGSLRIRVAERWNSAGLQNDIRVDREKLWFI